MSDKKFVCQLDKRRFMTKDALEQHRLEKHSVARNAVASVKKNKGQKPRQQQAAVVAMPQMVKSMPTDMARMSGTDRLFSLSINDKTASQSLLANLSVTPSLFKRLSMVAHAYQRVRYTRLRFRMEPQVPTSTAGGYVMGFVADPDDDGTSHTLDTLTAQRGSVTTKWWQSASVEMGFGQRLYFTHTGVEAREYSPGRLLLMVDGAPTVAGNFTIFCEWTAELSVATLDTTTCPGPTPGPTPPGPVPKFNMNALSMTKGDGKVYGVQQDGTQSSSIAAIIPGATVGQYWKMPSFVVFVGNNGTISNFTHLYVLAADQVTLCNVNPLQMNDQMASKSYKMCGPGNATLHVNEPPPVDDRVKQLEEEISRLKELMVSNLDTMGDLRERLGSAGASGFEHLAST